MPRTLFHPDPDQKKGKVAFLRTLPPWRSSDYRGLAIGSEYLYLSAQLVLYLVLIPFEYFKDQNGPHTSVCTKSNNPSPYIIRFEVELFQHSILLELGDAFRVKSKLWFRWISLDYRVTLGFGSIAGGLDHVNPVIRLPLEHEISRVLGKVDHPNLSVGTNQHRFIMDDPNITMEEYIRLEEEKARRQGRTFDWQTARYDKKEYYETEDDSFTDLGTEYPAIVLDDISDAAFSHEPTTLITRTNRWYKADSGDRLSMVYAGDNEEALFTSHVMRDTEIGLDVADTLCFQLDRARRRMT
ncbi:hypothetical protein Tco_0422335 [Tanacetum coccineum]